MWGYNKKLIKHIKMKIQKTITHHIEFDGNYFLREGSKEWKKLEDGVLLTLTLVSDIEELEKKFQEVMESQKEVLVSALKTENKVLTESKYLSCIDDGDTLKMISLNETDLVSALQEGEKSTGPGERIVVKLLKTVEDVIGELE